MIIQETLYAFSFPDGVALLADVGKAVWHLERGAEIVFRHKSHSLGGYEVLVGDPRAFHWVKTGGVPDPGKLDARPFVAGVDVSGHQKFVAQVGHGDSTQPARVSTGTLGTFGLFNTTHWKSEHSFAAGAYVAYGGGEMLFQVSHSSIHLCDTASF